MLKAPPAGCLCEEALIKRRIPSAVCQLIIQPLNVNHIWQVGSLCPARLFGLFTRTSVNLLTVGLLRRAARRAAPLLATVTGWLLIKELSAEAQRQNSSQGKVTCNDDPSQWI